MIVTAQSFDSTDQNVPQTHVGGYVRSKVWRYLSTPISFVELCVDVILDSPQNTLLISWRKWVVIGTNRCGW